MPPYNSDLDEDDSGYSSAFGSLFGYDSDPEPPPPVLDFEECVMNIHTGIYDEAISNPLELCSTSQTRYSNAEPSLGDTIYTDHLEELEHAKDWQLHLNIRTGKEFKHSNRKQTDLPVHCQWNTVVTQAANGLIDQHLSSKVQEGDSESFEPFDHVDGRYIHTVLTPAAKTEEQINAQSSKMILSTLSAGTIKFLKVDYCLPARFDVLTNILGGMSNLMHVDMDHIRIGDVENAVHFTNALQSLKELDILYLSYCGIGDNADIICSALHSKARLISLNHNNIGPEGARAIANCVASNKTPETLFLQFNGLGDEGARIIAGALVHNCSLHGCWLTGNDFTAAGVKNLFKAVLNLDSLDTASDSNHICKLQLLDDSCVMDQKTKDIVKHISSLNWSYKPDVRSIRRRKVSYAMWWKGGELLDASLADVLVELIPDVLSLIRHKYDETILRTPTVQTDAKVLNMVYSIIRKWPSLFSYRHVASGGSKRKRGDVFEV